MVASWTTDRQGGFTNRDLALLTQLLPRLALAVQARLGHEIAVNLLDTYVGPEAGRRSSPARSAAASSRSSRR